MFVRSILHVRLYFFSKTAVLLYLNLAISVLFPSGQVVEITNRPIGIDGYWKMGVEGHGTEVGRSCGQK